MTRSKKITNRRPVSLLGSFLMSLLLLVLVTRCQMDDQEIVPDTDQLSSAEESASGAGGPGVGCNCDHVVDSYVTDGAALGIQPGDVICLDASKTYSRIVFKNIVGTRNEPVIIRNCGGIATIYSTDAFGVKFQDSKDFKFVGDGGSPDEYGIKVTTERGFYIIMEHFTTDFEIAQIEVAGSSPNGQGDRSGFAGIGVKTSPYQACDVFTDPRRQAWVMRDVNIHNNYIHDVGGEGIYMGHGFWTGRKESQCPSVTYSHAIRNVQIYENRIENVGYDGLQIKNADQNVKVYNNVIRNYGTKNHGAHNEGILIGEGATGEYFGNIVDTGTGNGCMIMGLGNLHIYNNLFLNSGGHGIYAVHGAYVRRYHDGEFNIFNNTIYNTKNIGFVFYNEDGGPKRFINNLVVGAGVLTGKGAPVDMQNNVFTNNMDTVRFADIRNYDFHLLPGSEGIDAGADLSTFGIVTDMEGILRSSGTFDIGAFESTEQYGGGGGSSSEGGEGTDDHHCTD